MEDLKLKARTVVKLYRWQVLVTLFYFYIILHYVSLRRIILAELAEIWLTDS